MNYQQFVCAVERKVKQQMTDGMTACIRSTTKNNGKKRIGIMVSEEGSNVSPTIYLEEYFEQFQKHKSIDIVVKNILRLYREVRVEHTWEMSMLQSFSKTRQKIVYKLIHAEENKELLKTIPHVLYLDLAIVFYILLDISESGTAIILITNDIMKTWKIEKELLYTTAHENTKKILPAEFQTMRSMVAELLGEGNQMENGEDFMYVLTNEIRSFGAACILYDELLEDIGKRLGENYYVLPSSVHEVIIVPESKSPNRLDLEDMIEEINDTQVEEEEILSYRAYYFSRKEKRLIL